MLELTEKETSEITLETAIFVHDTNNGHKYTIRLPTNTVQFHSNLQWYTITQNLGNFQACADSGYQILYFPRPPEKEKERLGTRLVEYLHVCTTLPLTLYYMNFCALLQVIQFFYPMFPHILY